MKIRLGMSPISWSNDDLPQLGGETPLEVCLAETRQAGFTGTENGGKFPKEAGAAEVCANHDLALVSGWYSGTMINNELASEIEQITPQLTLFRDVGAPVIVYGETYETVQNRQERPVNASRPKLSDFDVVAYGRRPTALAEHCADFGVPLTFHHHMGTAVETEAELDQLMAHTQVRLLAYCWIPAICFLRAAIMRLSLKNMASASITFTRRTFVKIFWRKQRQTVTLLSRLRS